MDFKIWFEENKKNPNWPKKLKKIDNDLYTTITNWVENAEYAEKAFLYLNDLKNKPLCSCGNSLKWYKGIAKGYSKTCSSKCGSIATSKVRSETLKNKSAEEKKLIGLKAKETNLKRYGENYGSERASKISTDSRAKIEQARKLKMIEKYGVENPSHLIASHEKRKIAYKNRTIEDKKGTRLKTAATRIASGTSLPSDHPEIYASFKKYKRRVRYLTNRIVSENPEKFIGRSKTLHVDHILSITDGFNNKINPEIISNLHNLRLISDSDNSKKNIQSHITLVELLELIGNNF